MKSSDVVCVVLERAYFGSVTRRIRLERSGQPAIVLVTEPVDDPREVAALLAEAFKVGWEEQT
jgi:hypothetical protein